MSNEQLRRRLDSLQGGACSECDSRPRQIHVTYPEPILAGDEDRPLPAAQYCPECGAEVPLALIRVEYEDE